MRAYYPVNFVGATQQSPLEIALYFMHFMLMCAISMAHTRNNEGGYVPYPLKDARGHKMPNLPPVGEDCPFNMFRTGIDNAPSPLSMVSNLMDTSRYLNVSRPGCWAYPDMLELGTPVVGQHASRPDPTHPNGRPSLCNKSDGTVGDTGPRLSLEQGKAEFAAWCSVSSPLILGFDIVS